MKNYENTNQDTLQKNFWEEFLTEESEDSGFAADEFEELSSLPDRKTGIAISAIMIVLGIIAAFFPLPLGMGIGFIATAALGIYGVTQVITYIQTRPEYRNSWTLTGGILLLLFSLFLFWGSLGNAYGSLQLVSVITFSVGFFTLSNGIDQINAFSVLRKKEIAGTGWLLAGGILNLILSAFMIINPLFTWFSLSIVWGIYLILSGIAFLAETLSGRSSVSIETF